MKEKALIVVLSVALGMLSTLFLLREQWLISGAMKLHAQILQADVSRSWYYRGTIVRYDESSSMLYVRGSGWWEDQSSTTEKAFLIDGKTIITAETPLLEQNIIVGFSERTIVPREITPGFSVEVRFPLQSAPLRALSVKVVPQ